MIPGTVHRVAERRQNLRCGRMCFDSALPLKLAVITLSEQLVLFTHYAHEPQFISDKQYRPSPLPVPLTATV
jgi:hypothetical protein